MLYLALTVAFTYPLILNLQTSFYGFPGDTYGIIGLWWTKYALFDLHASPLFCPIIGYPFGVHFMYPSPIVTAVTVFTTLLLGAVASYNFTIILSFVIAGLGAYYLTYILTESKYSSFVSGCIFAFAPYHFAHSIHHLGLTQIQWFPFCLAYLFKLRIDRSYKNALLFTILLIMQMFSDPYYALFVVIMVLTFIAVWAYSDRLKSLDLKTVKLGLLSLCITIATSALVYIFLMRPATSHSGVVPSRDLAELVIYSARPWDFLVPMIYHPVFGKYTFNFIMSHLHGSNPVEQTLYLGYIPLMLAIFAIYCSKNRIIRDDQAENENFAITFSLALIIASLLFMLPAYIRLGNLIVPSSLSYFLYKITPIFRVMTRFDVLIMLAVAILAGIGSKYLTKSKIAIIIILGLIMFEYMPVPVAEPLKLANATRPGQIFPYSEENYLGDTTLFKIPDVYYWLAKQDNISIIAEYPMVEAPGEYESIFYRYLFYQMIHKKTLVNGPSPDSRALQKMLYNLNDNTAVILSDLGATHILVHGPVKVESERLIPIRHFENVTVYEVAKNSTAYTPPLVLGQTDGWHNQEFWNGIPTRWINGDAGLMVFSKMNCTAELRFSTMSFSEPRTLIVSANGIAALNKEIPLDFIAASCQLNLKKGLNDLYFSVPEGCSRPVDNLSLENCDGRCLSLAIQNLTLKKI
ncbi:MAG: hypothetical protein AB9879_04740 [Methanothrix sp.]